MNDNFFEKYGLEVQASSELEVGKSYPIYGMITKIIDDTPGSVMVELNFSIKCEMEISEPEKIELLKSRAFEPGIFVSEVKDLTDGVLIYCKTVVYGKKQEHHA